MTDFSVLLQKYADVAIKIGLNLRKGQRLFISAPLEARDLIYALTRSAYKSGAKDVHVNWVDQMLSRIRLEDGSDETLTETSQWLNDALANHIENGDAILSVAGSDPDLMAGLDQQRMRIWQKAAAQSRERVSAGVTQNKCNWLVILTPHPALSAKVFPDLSPEEAEARYWEVIFQMCRIDQADPVAAWKAHIADLSGRAKYLNDKNYSGLHYTSPTTDLHVGLPQGHIWAAAGSTAQNGIDFVANIPTEEVFTLAHTDNIDGLVKSTKPLNYGGTLIENFTLQFSEGSVVNGQAERGQEALDNLLSVDAGARSIGELALVPHSSPISQSGLMFYNTLFDENASSHIALGRAYRFTLEGGNDMSEEEFAQAGGNTSLVHVDFMIGSEDMNIDGIKADGSSEAVMRKGEWAFKV